jgi:FAD/FMN-containing dehydrogenase
MIETLAAHSAGKNEFGKYLTDASNSRGILEKIHLPKNTAEISFLLEKANREGIAVTIAGAGTGLTGARVPNGGVIISTERMNRMGPVEWDERQKKGRVMVEPGVVLKDFQEFLEKQGLFYPPDPTGIFASMGGTVATNASGARSFKYGATRQYVSRLEIVLAGGEVPSAVNAWRNQLEKATSFGRDAWISAEPDEMERFRKFHKSKKWISL